MRLALIFDKTRPDTTGVYFERACRSLHISCDHWWLRDVARIPKGYDLYLRVDHGDDYATRLPNDLRPAVFYAIDTHLSHNWPKIRRLAPTFDLVFCCHWDAARRLQGATWLPVACDPVFHGPAGGPPMWDVAFIGMDGGVPRKFYLQALRERYPNSFIGTAEHSRLGEMYSRARIGFNYAIANDVNMRTFEVLASGTLLVTNALAGNDLQQLGLEDRRHLVCYRNPQELFPLIDYYLSHAEERHAIARAGTDSVRTRHTYAHRLEQLLRHVSQTLKVPLVRQREESLTCVSS